MKSGSIRKYNIDLIQSIKHKGTTTLHTLENGSRIFVLKDDIFNKLHVHMLCRQNFSGTAQADVIADMPLAFFKISNSIA